MQTTRPQTVPSWMKWMLIITALITLLAVSIFGLLTVDAIVDFVRTAPLNRANDNPILVELLDETQPLAEVGGDGLPTPEVLLEVITEEEAAKIPTAEPLPTLTQSDRLTVLVMGLDRRTGENFISRTDTMILFSLDPQDGTASILSVPRDLYVDIPNYGRSRINTAFVIGARDGGEEGGAQLAMQSIERNLGVQVDHYLMVDFDTVISIVDMLGGVTVDVPSSISDPLYPDMNYGYDPFYISAGVQSLDGETALKYMRTRHTDNDFGRSRRQQQVLFALRDRVFELGFTNMLRRTPSMLAQVRDGIFTDLTVEDIQSIANASSEISADSIQTGVLDYEYVYSHTTASGASVLIVRTEEVTSLIETLFK